VTSRIEPQAQAEDAYCPHCHLLIEAGVRGVWPATPLRCPHCRLMVGAGRARSSPSEEPGARGSAAGVFAHEARRSGSGDGDQDGQASADEVRDGIRRAAAAIGARPERLLMVDYQQQAVDGSLPPLSDVFAAFGTWKRARRAAASPG
jgi:hypothetical protein